MLESITLSVCVILIYILIYYIYNYFVYSRKLPPGPISLPFIGTSHVLNKYCVKYKGLHNAFIELCKYYKSDIIGITIGGKYAVVVQGDKLVDEVLLNNEFLGRPDTFFIRLRSCGTRKGITMTDGYFWQVQRMFAMKQLHNLGFGTKTTETLIQEELSSFFRKNKSAAPENIILKANISRCVMNVLWALVTGSRFENDDEIDDLLNLMNKRSKAFDLAGGKLSQFPWLRFIAPESSGYNVIVKLNNKIRNIIVQSIEEHKATYSKEVTRDFIDAFLHEMFSFSEGFTEDQLIMVCLDFFIAGSLTTSSTIDFIILNLILNPDVQEKLFLELSSVLQPGQISSLSHKEIMPYAQAVISENERIFPISPILGPRRVLKETILREYKVPKNTIMFMNIFPSARNPEVWQSPLKFNPERFLNNNTDNENNKLYTFGKGKRRCPGEKLAKDFIFLFITSFFNFYKIESADKHNPPSFNYIPGIVLSTIPYEVSLIPRYK